LKTLKIKRTYKKNCCKKTPKFCSILRHFSQEKKVLFIMLIVGAALPIVDGITSIFDVILLRKNVHLFNPRTTAQVWRIFCRFGAAGFTLLAWRKSSAARLPRPVRVASP
jgi:hypothetical protein